MINPGNKHWEYILDYWFGQLKEGELPAEEKRELWWFKDPDFDNEIKTKFEFDLISAKRGAFKSWEESPRGSLALIILLDQFSRNIYRDTEQSFSQDKQALGICLNGLEKGFHKMFHPVECVFYYIPLMHSEESEMQNKSVEYYLEQAEEFASNPSLSKMLSENKLFAENHCMIIEKFGRYPHRNKILGRTSTPEEIEFLQGPGSSF